MRYEKFNRFFLGNLPYHESVEPGLFVNVEAL